MPKKKPPKAPSPAREHETDDPLVLAVDGLSYMLDGPPRKDGKKVVVAVRLGDGDEGGGGAHGAPLVDRCDLYAYRSRLHLATLVSETFGRTTGDVIGHLAVLLDQAERAAEAGKAPPEVVLTDAHRRAAEALLVAPDLLDRVAGAMEALGYVGEEQTKRLVYLAATSRLMASPLNVLLLAPSGAGKSSVLDAVTALVPPESVVALTRLTPMSLYYMGAEALRHKLVVVDEYDGQADADHAVRVLQSRGELRVSVTVQGKAQSLVVRGPVAVMSGTVSPVIDRQNASRCLELTLDDSAAQTRRIQAAQARRAAGQVGPGLDVRPLVDAQRLLEPLEVVVPYATRLAFPARTTGDRRASAKLLGLIPPSPAAAHDRPAGPPGGHAHGLRGGQPVRVAPHLIRHTTAMHLLRSGVDLVVIAAWLDHADVSTTHGYVAVDLRMKQAAVAGAALPGPGRRVRYPAPKLVAWLKAVGRGQDYAERDTGEPELHGPG